ncbi:saccharopine dehydrogenase [Paenibacillus sp. N3/727]|uniref:saccharopine dehydrogenase n=1 Tax=Paenibacillus sp. N3/727 TaxID=2925845 RepID=UPI001F537A4E|nr:saccharopine dehydrogenase [Paenibacillus sp. N3/727]UNK18351.1 saccharopine dehydrogenase [Paenibacillus sp. N3/727]
MNSKQGLKNIVLIVGGYGVVGSQAAQILHDRHPDLEIWLGGRNQNHPLPFESNRVRIVSVNNTAADPLAELDHNPTLIINSVNDPDDRLLLSAMKRKIPLVDITRWTERFQQSIQRLQALELQSPVVLASGWMGGTASLLATVFSNSLREVTVNIHALYSLKDKAGPDSTAYMDRLSIPFEIINNQAKQIVYPMTDPVRVRFANEYETKCYRLDTPDHMTLPSSTHVTSASFRIAFDSKVSTYGLVSLVKTGIWKRISEDRFRGLRKGILYNPGSGSAHHLVIQIKGYNESGILEERSISITDPSGQTHLTALGAVIQAENLLRAQADRGWNSGVYFPENALTTGMSEADVLDFYREHGVEIVNRSAGVHERYA